LNNYELTKKELRDMYNSKGKEAMFRSKARWLEQGEKPTKYFFNLEKKNYDRKIVKELKDENKQILTNFKEVNKRIEDHFSKILSSKIAENDDVQRVNFNQYAKDIEIPSLSNEEQIEMENELTMEEIKRVKNSFRETKCRVTTRAANNCRSSDIGRPKFAHVRRNPKCGRT